MKRASSPLSPSAQRPTKIMSTSSNGVEVAAPVMNLLIKRLSDKATLPKRGSALAAGYDLYRSSLFFFFMSKAQKKLTWLNI
jgi:dUTP pyrophosphatase